MKRGGNDRLQLTALFSDEDAVSPVIGVILMVAITVILAAVIGTFTLGLYEGGNEAAPSVDFDTVYDEGVQTLTVTHTHGETIETSQLEWVVTGDDEISEMFSGPRVTAGDSVTLTGVESDETVRLVWSTKGEERSATIMKWEGPDA